MSRATVEIMIELGRDARVTRDLLSGGVYVPGCMLRLGELCDVVVCGANHQIWLAARAVYVDEQGAGLELIGFSSALKAQLAELAELADPLDEGDDDLAIPIDDAYGADDDAYGADDDAYGADDDAYGADDDAYGADSEAARLAGPGRHAAGTLDPEARAGDLDEGDANDSPGSSTSGRRLARNVHERLRGLNLAAQIKMATSGELHERIVLERLYGKNVWETLLRNPRLTAPEVSRIARYGSLPRILLEVILANNAWLQIPEVRRALLSNPRLGTDQIMKVLRLTPKYELKLATVQTAYPQAVRNAAKLILRGD